MFFQTKSGKTILVESKGDHFDGLDSEAKCRLGNEWINKQDKTLAILWYLIIKKIIKLILWIRQRS